MSINSNLGIRAGNNCLYDYIPVVSTIVNLMDLFQKHVVMPLKSSEVQTSTPYYSYLKDKSSIRCMILLIPILGNIVIACYDRYMQAKDKSPEQPEQQPIHSPDSPPSQVASAPVEIQSAPLPAPINPFPLLELPLELLPVIFSFLSPQELGRLASVSKVTQEVANHEDRWEKLCKEKDQELSQTKPANQSWKKFYKNELDLREYQENGRSFGIAYGGLNVENTCILVNSKATVFHVKKILSRNPPYLSVKETDLYFAGEKGQDDELFFSYTPWGPTHIIVRKQR